MFLEAGFFGGWIFWRLDFQSKGWIFEAGFFGGWIFEAGFVGGWIFEAGFNGGWILGGWIFEAGFWDLDF